MLIHCYRRRDIIVRVTRRNSRHLKDSNKLTIRAWHRSHRPVQEAEAPELAFKMAQNLTLNRQYLSAVHKAWPTAAIHGPGSGNPKKADERVHPKPDASCAASAFESSSHEMCTSPLIGSLCGRQFSPDVLKGHQKMMKAASCST